MLRSTRTASIGAQTRIAIMPAPASVRENRRARAAIGLASVCLLAACANTSATPVSTPTPSPTPTPVPSPSGGTFSVSPTAQAYLVPLAGYEYVVLPTAVEHQMASGFASNPAVLSVIKGYAASSVTKAGEAQAVVLVLDANQSFTALPATMTQFWTGVGGSAGAPAKASTLAGQEVQTVDGTSSKLVGWHDANLIVLVFGTDMAPTSAVAEALIKAHA
jgi:hypothetical protein